MLGKSKKGSYILESALVLPVSILVLITVVLIVMFFYSEGLGQCSMHMALRNQSGSFLNASRYDPESGSQLNSSGLWNGDISESGGSFNKQFEGNGYIFMGQRGLLDKYASSNLSGKSYSISGTSYVLFYSLKNSVIPTANTQEDN